MSVIQKIRTKYAKLAGGVIALALVGFILMDALSSRSNSLFGNDNSIVKVNGEKVDYIAYTQRTKDYELLYSNNQAMDENMRAQVDDMALQDLIKEQLITDEAEKLGLTVTEAEKKDMIYGNEPDMMVRNYQAFMDPNTKAFNPQYVKLFEEQAMQLDPTGKALAQWETLREYIKRTAITRKYAALFTASVYAPKFLTTFKANEFAQMASIDYVNVPYEFIKDEEVKLTDEDYKNFVKNHPADFKIDEDTRGIEYVAFNVLPTSEDTARSLGALNAVKEEFATTTDNESFVNRNSEESYIDQYVMKGSFKSLYADSIFNMPVGTVAGPMFEQDNYMLVKVIDKKTYPDSVTCRHILINTEDRGQPVLADTVAKARIDSIAAAIKGGASFVEMVQKYSGDDGSKEKGGEYSFSFEQKAGLVKEFGDFVFEGKPGETKIVKAESGNYSGYHFIEIIKQGAPATAAKLGVVSKALYAGNETENDVYAKATEFAGESQNAEAFEKNVKAKNLQKLTADNIKVSDFTVYGIGPSREIIRWMYNAELNNVSPVFQLNGKYVVAKLANIRKKGLMEVNESLKKQIEPMVKNDKKGELIVKKLESKKSLAEIAATTGSQVAALDSFRGNNSFSGTMGYVPKVVGYTFNKEFKANTMSKALKEQQGVYYIVVKNKWSKPDASNEAFIQSEQNMMKMEAKNAVSTQVPNQLKKKATIKYNPDNF